MNLDKIELPAFMIQYLFQKNLVDISDVKKDISSHDGVTFLGNNKKNITVIICGDEAFLPDKQKFFLSGILKACKLNLDDVAVVNIAGLSIHYKTIFETLKPEIILLFGIVSATIQLPFVIPDFQKQSYNDQIYLSAPSLHQLENNKELKQKLWINLKEIFSL